MVGRAVGIAAASWAALSSSLFNCCHTGAPSLLSASSSLALSSCGSIFSSSSISNHQLGSAVCCYGTGDEKIYSSQWESYSKERQPKLLNQLEGSKQRSAIKKKKDWRSVKQATVEAGKQSREAQTDRKQCKSSAGLGLLSEDDKALFWDDSRSDWIYQVDRVEDIQDDSFLDAVVKVYCTHSEPDYSLPWQKRRQFHSTGSGFMISGRRLLTNAHCVEHHTQVKVKRRGDDTKFVAKVLAIGPECDIALLTVDDDNFWKGVEPLKFGSLPRLQDGVIVVGYPVGGETISVTSGVVSRIEVTSYVHGASELLTIQIDAAVNPGNSGGPAFNDRGECVGIAFQVLRLVDAENIGLLIPTTVIYHFLNDYERNGIYTGFPCLGVWWQRLESSALRSFLKMKPSQKGVLIQKVAPTAPAYDVLQKGDVILRFDGIPVANEGTVPFRSGERIDFHFLVTQKFSGESAEVEILRDGKVMKVQTSFKPPVHLVPIHNEGRLPSYFIVAGLVFVPVCQPYIVSDVEPEDSDWSLRLLERARNGVAEFDDEQIVVMSQVLANDLNIGYEDITNAQILKKRQGNNQFWGKAKVQNFNGVKIRNLKQLAQLVDSCTDEFMCFQLDETMMVVLDTKASHLATPQILKDYSIPLERSQDLINLT